MKIKKIEKIKNIIQKKTHESIMAHECQIWYLITRLYICEIRIFLARL